MAILVVVALVAAAASGCSASTMQKAESPAATAKAGKMAKGMTPASADTSPGIPSCYECSGKGTPPVVEGKATIQNGTQVVSITVVNGYYSPNRITVTMGMPVKVVFTGKTKDCAGKPKFASLGKQIDIRSTGSGSIDLGTLASGSYRFTCGMGANAGMIVVR